MFVDANLLLYAYNANSPQHRAAGAWLEAKLRGDSRVGLPWQSLAAFLRLATNPRVFRPTLDGPAAWAVVERWLDAPAAWTPHPGSAYAGILGGLIVRHDVRGKLVTDAQLAALAIEHGVELASADTDFARFPELRWVNPLA